MHERRAAALLAAALALLPAPLAHAHGGAILLERDAGAYGVLLNGAPLQRDPRAVDYTVTLRRDGRPDETADVRVRVRTGDGGWSRAYAAERAANTYEVVLAQPARDSWRAWDVRVEIDGAGGPARATALASAFAREEPSSPAPLVPVLASLALLAAGAVVAVRRRRRPFR